MAIVNIKGRIGYIQEAKGGLILSIAENKPNKLAKTVWQRVAIWGNKAKAIAKHVHKGAEFEFRCDIDKVSKNGRTYFNFTVDTWKPIVREEVKPEPQTEDPDDWFVAPNPNLDSKFNRRYEGFHNQA